MSRLPRRLARLGKAALLLLALAGTSAAGASGTLRWRTDRNQVDADVDGWPLATLLEEIATDTGWQLYVEPGTQLTVTARFEKLGAAEALRRLLPGLSFALLPQVSGPPKLFVFQGSVDLATEQVKGRPRPAAAKRRPIADERLVVLRPGGDVESLARRLGATVLARIDGMRAYRLRFDSPRRAADAERALARDPDVDSVEPNLSVTPPAVIEPVAADGAAPARLVPDISPSTDRVLVGLIDMPVQDADGRLQPFLEPGISVRGDYQPPSGPLGHGTAMAETILDGVARALAERGDTSGKVALSILPIDVYGGNDATDMFSVAQGLYEALNRHVNVVNLSLGGDHDSRLLRELTQEAAKHGVVVVAAAGNEPVATPMYPAADPGVISVTASDANGDRATYANSGRWVDAMGPGENVVRWADRSWWGAGTSFATSWVSGWAAGYLTSPDAARGAATRATLQRWRVPASR